MTMKNNEGTILQNKALVYIVQENVAGPLSLSNLAVRTAVIRATTTMELEIQLLPFASLAEVKLSERNTYFLCSSMESFGRAKEAFADVANVYVAAVVCPTGYPGWGSDQEAEFKQFKKHINEGDLIFTDSDLSRDLIESVFSDRRIDVFYVYPDFSLVETQIESSSEDSVRDVITANAAREGNVERWSFGAAKQDTGYTLSKVDATQWDTWGGVRSSEPPITSHELGQAVELTPEQEDHNNRVIKRAFRGIEFEGDEIKLGILGHKLSFIDELATDLARITPTEVILDEWKYLSAPSDKDKSRRILSESDVLIGEWARPNNIWMQENVAGNKRMIVRAHRYEVTVDFPHKIDMNKFYAGVVIVPWVGRKLVQDFGWPVEKMVYIPNYINQRYFDRPKLPGAEFTLGIVGITPSLKRLDLALDILARLRAEDARYNLRIRGGMPTSHPHWSENVEMRLQWGSILYRLRTDPLLRGAVHFDTPGRNMSAWYQQIGVILSTSDLEGSHVALAEGIASGALPVARRWPGIETLWPETIIKDSLDEAVSWILSSRKPGRREEITRGLKKLDTLHQGKNINAWHQLLRGNISAAQNVFGPIDWNVPIYQPVEHR